MRTFVENSRLIFHIWLLAVIRSNIVTLFHIYTPRLNFSIDNDSAAVSVVALLHLSPLVTVLDSVYLLLPLLVH